MVVLVSGSQCDCVADDLEVTTFNIRFANVADGADAWGHRKMLVVEVVREMSPDVLGMQEVLAEQLDYLADALDDYGVVVFGRDDGLRGGEMSPIFYRKKRFDAKETGVFWLSDRPDVAGSRGWDAALPRIVTWARLACRHEPDFEFLVFNAHFDHVGTNARQQSAQLLRQYVSANSDTPIIVMGDFNCPPASEPYLALITGPDDGTPLIDPFKWLKVMDDSGTYHAFTGEAKSGRIDWVLHSRHFLPLSVQIVRKNENGRYPSDHFPVKATLRLIAAPPDPSTRSE